MVRAPYIVSFVLAVCCSFRHNAAIPLASHSADDTNQMQDVFKEEKTNSQNNWNDTTLQSYTTREGELSDISSDKDSTIRIYNPSYRGPQKKKTMHRYKHGNNQASVLTKHDLEDVMSREQLVSCTNDKKKNQRYSSSFFGNGTNRNLNVDKEFEDVVGNNTKTKRTSSVHEGEDITLCWIETTTIKEDKTVQPPRRLVIREYTISFENSATIPDKYLECKKLDGELLVNDPDVGKLALFEVIDEDTKVSRVVNFTSIGHIGDINVWQYKKVKCGVGPVVSKDIIEWNDGSENPKKRVEIKVSPKLHKLTAKNEEEEPCTESSEESSTSSMGDLTYVTDTTSSCNNENGTCEKTTESNEVSTSYVETSTLTELPMISEASTEESEEDLNSVSATTSSSEEEDLTESSVTTEETIDWTRSDESLESSKKDHLNCEDSLDPACKDIKPPQWELSTESSTTETSTQTETWPTMTWTIPTITEKTTSSEFEENSSEESSSDLVSDLETSLPTTSTVSEYDSVSELTSEPTIETTTAIVESITSIDIVSGADSNSSEEEDKDLTDSSISSESTEDYYTSSAESTTVQPDKIDSSFEWSTVHTSDESLTTESVSMDTSEYWSTESTDEFLSTSEEETSESAFESKEETTPERTTRPIITEESTTSMTTSPPTSLIESTTSPSTTSSEVDYICSENSEDCVSDSESCVDSEDCSSTTCESGVCSEEQSTSEEKFDTTSPSPTTMKTPNLSEVSTEPKEIEFTATTASTPIFGENDNTWTAIISVPTTVETRKSTPLSVTAPRHKLVLKIKVLLEHVNENKEKESLVEVEKHLALDENPKHHHKHPDLLKQLKSFNDSINTEVINALLNCTSLANLTRDVNIIGKRLHDDHSKSEELQFTYPTDLILQSSKQNDEELQNSEQEHGVESRKRKRRAFADLVNPLGTNSMKENKKSRKKREQKANDAAYESAKSETESMAAAKDIERKKMEIVRRALPDISKDFSIGLQDVMSQLSQRNSILVNDPKKIAKRNLLDIVVDPKDNRFLSRRRRAATEEVGRWTNERIRKLPVGGKFRSFTEFVLYDILS